jgi:hypothetical protein
MENFVLLNVLIPNMQRMAFVSTAMNLARLARDHATQFPTMDALNVIMQLFIQIQRFKSV